MTDRKYTPYVLVEKKYPKLPEHLKTKLFDIEPSVSNGSKMWPCEVVLDNGDKCDCVYIMDADDYIRSWGVWPEDDPGKECVDILRVKDIRPSLNRLPVYLANKLYSSGESGMGYMVFTLLFSDNSSQAYVAGNAIDFVSLPVGKKMEDIVDVIPHRDRNLKNKVESPKYFWCLYST